ncbi:hypothetical protein CNMCM6106_009631 [Aspergillus hiratsukae]|uniref:FAD-binding FR-type domain-containing protein n=1 Tax=Aspergillus hiratsukae TaxID=1194566 RepID=A0A8H6PLV5_9EURO|nr:hypothetical protein CNMCM6106_009631 [Aspergillus hiratsukae]
MPVHVKTAPPAILTSSGVDFANKTQASHFLTLLNWDRDFQVDGNAMGRRFYYGIAAVVGIASICHFLQKGTLWMRLRASYADKTHPTQPRHAWTKALAKVTAIFRRITYPQVTPETLWFRVPPRGIIFMIIAYFAFILLLEFPYNKIQAGRYYTLYGVRSAWLAVAQLPLIVLLAGKNNIISLLTGVSYERLNVYHRWVARGCLFLATVHFAFLITNWQHYDGLTKLEWDTHPALRSGVAAYAIIVWMNISSIMPLRNWSYEFFIVQHILTFFGFIISIGTHIPGGASYALTWLYIPSALYLAERLIYAARYLFHNIRPGRATLEALEGGATRIRVSNRQIKSWASGTHVLLSLPRFGYPQAHPATILSTPTSHNGEMVFILRAYRGFSNRIYNAAASDVLSKSDTQSVERQAKPSYLALVNGPYGSSLPDFACFDTVMLISGATGVTFTLSILLDLAQRATLDGRKLPVRVIRFIWIIRKTAWISWISDELEVAAGNLANAGIACSIDIFATRDVAIADDNPDSTISDLPSTEKLDAAMNSDEIISELASDPVTPIKIDISVLAEQKATRFSVRSGRPNLDSVFRNSLATTDGESAVSVCGPFSLAVEVRQKVAALANRPGGKGVYLHVENFV